MKAQQLLRDVGIIDRDNYNLPNSRLTFSDGLKYKFEVPGIQSPTTFDALISEVERRKLVINRVTQTKGIMCLTDTEISEMVQLASGNSIELVLAVGPRATYDTSATAQTAEGKTVGYRLRGQDQVVRALEDIIRGYELGCSSFLVYDEGLLWVLNKLVINGKLSNKIKFKVSAHCGHGNSCSAFLMQELGAASINPVRDIQLQMLSAMRQSISIPIDIHTENPKSSGGFIRHYEVPEIVRIAAPVYLKTGGSVAGSHSWDTTIEQAKARARQVELVQRVMHKYGTPD